jgi:hypothetical protein
MIQPYIALANPLRDFNIDKQSSEPYFLPPQYLQPIIEGSGLSANDLKIRSLFDPRAREQLIREQERRYPNPKLNKSKVIFHARSEKGGQPVIAEEVVLSTLEERSRMANSRADFSRNVQQRRAGSELKNDFTKLKPLMSCDKARTESTNRNNNKDTESIVDVLFIPTNYRTSSPKDIFGQKTDVYVYDTANPDPIIASLNLALEIPCLPYRIRHTKSFLFEHFGEHALRNYDGNPHGNGQNLLQ